MTKKNNQWRALDGVLLFDKPPKISSNAALQKVRRLYRAQKAGHTGTLDPMATGLLPVCFGEATKFSNALLDADKSYRAKLRLGQTTTTGDAEGEIVGEFPIEFAQSDLDAALFRFRGEIEQLPPMHSALKYQGRPLYEYVRKGISIERQPRKVTIYELDLMSRSGNEMEIFVRCSKGTYVRTLAEDIGETLGCGAHLIALRRTSIAHFRLEDAHELQTLEAMGDEQRDALILPIANLMPDMPKVDLNADQARRMAQGQKLGMEGDRYGRVALYGPDGFIGIGLQQGRRLLPVRLLSGEAGRVSKDLTEVVE